MSLLTPIYAVRFSGSSGWRNVDFGTKFKNQIDKLSIKPGITSAIGSFEITLGDTGSSGEGFTNIFSYDDVYIWYGYDATGSSPDFRGKVETKESILDDNTGWTRRISGRDYGEALFRIYDRRAYTGSASGSVIAIKDLSGLSTSNEFISSSTMFYQVVMSNDNCFKAIGEISDVPSVAMDFYTDTVKKLHWFPRESKTGSGTFAVGTNIFNYRLIEDVADSKNNYYVFGMRNPDGVTGSDWPTGHDDWTESTISGWTGSTISGSTEFSTAVELDSTPASGSKAIEMPMTISYNETFGAWLRKTLPARLMLNSGDFLHLYYGDDGHWRPKLEIRLETDTSNYFTTFVECSLTTWTAGTKNEKTLYCGPEYEGKSITGSPNTNTGSYKWSRVGSPDWFNVNSFYISKTITVTDYAVPEGAGLFVDGLYFATRFQFYTGSVLAQTAFGKRDAIVVEERINNQDYCKNYAISLLNQNSGSITQIEFTTTGSPHLNLGFQYPITIPAENITAQNFTLIDLEHIIGLDGFTSKCLITNKKEVRVPIPIFNYAVTRTKEKGTWSPLGNKPWWLGGGTWGPIR